MNEYLMRLVEKGDIRPLITDYRPDRPETSPDYIRHLASDWLIRHSNNLILALKELQARYNRPQHWVVDMMFPITFHKSMTLANHPDLSLEIKTLLQKDLDSLPGYESWGSVEQQHDETQRWYGFSVAILLWSLERLKLEKEQSDVS